MQYIARMKGHQKFLVKSIKNYPDLSILLERRLTVSVGDFLAGLGF